MQTISVLGWGERGQCRRVLQRYKNFKVCFEAVSALNTIFNQAKAVEADTLASLKAEIEQDGWNAVATRAWLAFGLI